MTILLYLNLSFLSFRITHLVPRRWFLEAFSLEAVSKRAADLTAALTPQSVPPTVMGDPEVTLFYKERTFTS